MTEEEVQADFDDFFEDVFLELSEKYGELEEMHICDNLGDHLIGNVGAPFSSWNVPETPPSDALPCDGIRSMPSLSAKKMRKRLSLTSKADGLPVCEREPL